MTLHVRRARRDDSARLTRLAHDAKRFWGYSEELIRLWRDDLTVTPRFIADHAVYCAVKDSRIVGFYALSGEHGARELEHMWVDPRHIGRGVGRLLFAHLLGRLRREGVTRLRIASDPNAEGFYRKLGARRLGSVPSQPAGRHLPLLEIEAPDRGRRPALE